MIRNKQKWYKIAFIMVLCSFLTSCSLTENDPVKVLSNAMEKTEASKTFKIEDKLYGDLVDLYFKEDVTTLKQTNIESETFVKKTDDSLYCVSFISSDDSTSINISKRNNEIEAYLLGNGIENQQNGKAILDFYGEMSSINTTNYLYYIQLLIQREDCYTFSLEENDKEKIINVKLTDSAKLDELEVQRIKESNPDYDPLTTTSGKKLQKNEFIRDDYEFLINDKGIITKAVYLREIDYGEGFLEKTRNTFYYKDFDKLTINEKEIDSLLDQGLNAEIKSGEEFDYSKIIS